MSLSKIIEGISDFQVQITEVKKNLISFSSLKSPKSFDKRTRKYKDFINTQKFFDIYYRIKLIKPVIVYPISDFEKQYDIIYKYFKYKHFNSGEYETFGCNWCGITIHNVINYLRHQKTNYERFLDELHSFNQVSDRINFRFYRYQQNLYENFKHQANVLIIFEFKEFLYYCNDRISNGVDC